MTNKTIGNTLENKVYELLGKAGFWVHKIAQTDLGQPADLIAVRNQLAYLIDCKVCEKNSFPLNRIEPNQITAMELWADKGNGEGLFFIEFPKGLYVVPLSELLLFKDIFKTASVSVEDLTNSQHDYTYDTWRLKHGC